MPLPAIAAAATRLTAGSATRTAAASGSLSNRLFNTVGKTYMASQVGQGIGQQPPKNRAQSSAPQRPTQAIGQLPNR